MKPDTIAKLRDAFTMAADALQTEFENQMPAHIKEAPINLAFDPAKLTWQTKTGPKGEYEICMQTNHDEFKKAMSILESGGDRVTHLGFFYWVMTNRTAIARKQRAPKK